MRTSSLRKEELLAESGERRAERYFFPHFSRGLRLHRYYSVALRGYKVSPFSIQSLFLFSSFSLCLKNLFFSFSLSLFVKNLSVYSVFSVAKNNHLAISLFPSRHLAISPSLSIPSPFTVHPSPNSVFSVA